MTIRLPLAAALLACAMPAFAATHNVAPGEDAQKALQEALILAEPGDEIVLAAGRYTVTDGLSLDVDNVTVRGAGMDGTVLDFTGQQGSGEGLLVTSDNVTLRDFALENPKGDGIKSKGADNIVYHRIRVSWTRGPHAENGAYGIYPVESTGVLIDGVKCVGQIVEPHWLVRSFRQKLVEILEHPFGPGNRQFCGLSTVLLRQLDLSYLVECTGKIPVGTDITWI